jgi:hypothetical protein
MLTANTGAASPGDQRCKFVVGVGAVTISPNYRVNSDAKTTKTAKNFRCLRQNRIVSDRKQDPFPMDPKITFR